MEGTREGQRGDTNLSRQNSYVTNQSFVHLDVIVGRNNISNAVFENEL